MTKTKFAICGIATCIIASFGLSMCSDKDNTPLSPEVIKTAAMYKCSGFMEYLGQNTPNMPVDVQALHQEMAVQFYKVAGTMEVGAHIGSSMDGGRNLAKVLLKDGNRHGIQKQMQVCKDAIQIEMAKRPVEEINKPIEAVNPDKATKQEEEENALRLIEIHKAQRELYSQDLFQCAGIFIYNSTNIPGVSAQNKAQQREWGEKAFILAQALDKTVDGNIWGMKGAQKANRFVKTKDLQGMSEAMNDCKDSFQYVLSHKQELGM